MRILRIFKLIIFTSYGVSTLKMYPTWCSSITVEPAVILYFVAVTILEFINTNLYLQKACRDNATAEVDVQISCDNEQRGILFVSSVESTSKLIIYILQTLFLVYASQWSDLAGKKRKPLI